MGVYQKKTELEKRFPESIKITQKLRKKNGCIAIGRKKSGDIK